MCGIFPSNTFALDKSHACKLASFYGFTKAEHDGLHAVFAAIHGDKSAPFMAQVEVGLVFADLILRMRSEREIHTLPFTALEDKGTNEYLDLPICNRYRTDAMQSVHDAIVAFNMCEQRMTAVKSQLLMHFGFTVVMGHSCDISGIPEELDESKRKTFHASLERRDSVRSISNAFGTEDASISKEALLDKIERGVILYFGRQDLDSFTRIADNKELVAPQSMAKLIKSI